MRVPADLHAAVGRRVFTETLGTKDRGLALFREREAEIEERYRRLRASTGQEPTQKQIAALAGEFCCTPPCVANFRSASPAIRPPSAPSAGGATRGSSPRSTTPS